jgi:hypothetical protein
MARWTTRDPLEEKDYWNSAYVYCGNNPVKYVDPDGREAGDFVHKGKIIGNDGKDDGKLYVVKTTQKSFQSGNDVVQGAGLSKVDEKATTDFISNNSGNTAAFEANSIAYDNSIEIKPDAALRQQMVDVASKDDGHGGGSDNNNREYGASVENGIMGPVQVGPVSTPEEGASVELSAESPTFHTHPSGTSAKSGVGYPQPPSPQDINNAGSFTNFVFGRRGGNNGYVYIYNANGVQAVIKTKYFVNPTTK